MRAALALCDLGQRIAKQQATAGRTEIEIFTALRQAMDLARRPGSDHCGCGFGPPHFPRGRSAHRSEV